MQVLLQLLANLWLGARLTAAIAPHAHHLPDQQVAQIGYYIAEASSETGIDPYLIAAIMWHESGFRPGLQSKTDDHGLMQVHWQRSPVKWLRGLTREALLDPRANILAGARELAWSRRYCLAKDYDPEDHLWWGHYKYGRVVLAPKYGDTVLRRRDMLSRSRWTKPGS